MDGDVAVDFAMWDVRGLKARLGARAGRMDAFSSRDCLAGANDFFRHCAWFEQVGLMSYDFCEFAFTEEQRPFSHSCDIGNQGQC